jgi:hypothetical protein
MADQLEVAAAELSSESCSTSKLLINTAKLLRGATLQDDHGALVERKLQTAVQSSSMGDSRSK